jgi:hypothetical protein
MRLAGAIMLSAGPRRSVYVGRDIDEEGAITGSAAVTLRKLRTVSMNLAMEIGFDR